MPSREYWMWEIDIHGCYLIVKIVFVPICLCKKNRGIWQSQCQYLTFVVWRHSTKSEKTVFGDNGEMSIQLLFLVELCAQDIK